MFEKLLNKPVANLAPFTSADSAAPRAADTPQGEAVQKVVTVIAADAEFCGDIVARGEVQIRGRVQGNVIVKEGCVKLMRSGHVEGDILAAQILLDGAVRGRCIADAVEVLEHGRLDGIVQSGQFSIRTGGHFVGHAEAALDAPVAEVAIEDVPSLTQPLEEDAAISGQHVYRVAS